MNKREFFSVLEYELGNLDQSAKADIINDFAEHFDIAEKAGKTEEEICRILGDPREIAKDFTGGTALEASTVGISPEPSAPYRQDDSRYAGYAPNAPAAKPAYHEAPDRENDVSNLFPRGSLIKRMDANVVSSVRIELYNSDLKVKGEQTDYIKLDVDSDDEYRFSTAVLPGGVFYVKEEQKNRSSAEIALSLPGNFGGNIEIQSRRGDVEVNRFDGLHSFKLKTASGDADISRIQCAEEFWLSLASGDANISYASAGRFMAKTGSGDINAEKVTATGAFSFATGSGDIDLAKCSCSEGFHISTGSGDISASYCVGNLKATTGSGSVDVSDHNGTVWASSGSGDIDIKTDEIVQDVSYSTGSGEISLTCQRLSGNIRLSSGSGDIDFNAYDVQGDITAKTGSGNVCVGLGRDSDVRFQLKVGRHGSVYNAFNELDARSGNAVNRENARYKTQLETTAGDIEVNVL